MKQTVILLLVILSLLVSCTPKEKPTKETKFDYNRVMQIELVFNDFVKTHYEYMKMNPEDTAWEVFYQNYQEEYAPLVETFKAEKLHEPIIRGMENLNESVQMVNTYYVKKINDEPIENIEQQITEKFTAIEENINQALELGEVRPTKEMTQEVKEIYNQYLTAMETKDVETYAHLLWDEDKEKIKESFEREMEKYTIDYELHQFELIHAYEDSRVVKVIRDMKYLEVPEGIETENLQLTINVTFLNKNNEWKIYMEETMDAKPLE